MFAISVIYAVFPAFCISSHNFVKWKPYKDKSSYYDTKEKEKKLKRKQLKIASSTLHWISCTNVSLT